MFAEGGTTNGTHIVKFKKGAFYSLKRIRPVCLKHSIHGTQSMAFEVVY